MDIELIGANQNCEIIAEGKSADYIQYYNHAALDVHAYQKITYKNIYSNIDWVIYVDNRHAELDSASVTNEIPIRQGGRNEGAIKYDFIVHPGGNPSNIKLKTHWTENTNLNTDGSLSLTCSMGTVTEQAPISYQEGKEIKTQFSLSDSTIQFDIANYDKSKTLIIDPFVRIWGTYYGGSGGSNFFISLDVDKQNNVYCCGGTTSKSDIASAGHQNTLLGYFSAIIVKFNSCGERVWATYYCGEAGSGGLDCTIDTSGNIILFGFTDSKTGISFNGHQNGYGGGRYDHFLAKFNPNGLRLWATYYGGSLEERFSGGGISKDNQNNLYISGNTFSNNQISNNGFKNSINAFNLSEGYLVKFDSNGVRQWSTYYGGNFGAGATDCAADNNGNVYLIGSTQSNSLISHNGFQNIKWNNNDQ